MSGTATVSKRELVAIAVGGVCAGAFDIIQVMVFYALKGVEPIRILQSVASGLLGKASFAGGLPTAGLGLGLHFGMTLIMAAVYVLAARRLEVLIRRPWTMGSLYGLGLYVVMTYVVVPLSLAGSGAFDWLVFLDGIFAHVLAVGMPIALAARWRLRTPATDARSGR
ncbi:hypothetical protein [Caulobacter sp. DWR1-3-2b1]|uniref:hypothetical protein n=1 Tax=Caulobacter sp. DWR1-3-2b1 TaxID=2804670 RepID=UPI003CF86E39